MKKSLWISLSVALMSIAGLVAYSQGYFDVWFDGKEELITYYQWTDSTGKVYITQSPPSGNTKYVLFKSTKNLMESEHSVDPKVINDANAYLETRQKNTQSNSSNTNESVLESQQQSVECRWLVGRIQELKRLVKQAEHLKQSRYCKEYYKRRRELSAEGCDASYSETTISEC